MLASSALSGQINVTVTKTADTNDGSCDFDDCSLREAIIAANASSVDNIDIPAGTYKLTIPGRGEDFAATGDLDIRRGVTIRGAGARNTIIDGNGIDRVFHTPFQGTSTPFFVNIFGVKITGGAATDLAGAGGGISHEARDATLNLSDSTVSGNSASRGGGINSSTLGSNTMTIKRSTISGNKASAQGGGIENSNVLTLENTTVSGNKSNIGGGIFQGDETLRITDSTIAFNTAQNSGGGISIDSATNAKNTIVSNNKAKFEKNCSGPVTTSEGNNLEKGTTCGFTQPTDVNADPMLGKLANNGGPTDTRALGKGSPAIDAGGTPFPPTDQRGVARPQGAANDIGAYEKQ